MLTNKELQEMWKRTPEKQLAVADAKIIEAFSITQGDIAVSWSGGKDSTFLLWRVALHWKDIYGDRPLVVVFCDTTNEHKETYQFIEYFKNWIEKEVQINIELKITRPANKANFITVAKEQGLPLISKAISRDIRRLRKYLKLKNIDWENVSQYHKFANDEARDYLQNIGLNATVVLLMTGWIKKRQKYSRTYILPYKYAPLMSKNCHIVVSEKCCDILKKEPAKEISNLSYFTGEMACDSKMRETAYLSTGCNSFKSGRGKSKPLGAMLEQTLLKWYSFYKLPLNAYYGEIKECENQYHCNRHSRGGCALCGFGIEHEPDRFIKLYAEDYPKCRIAFLPKEQGGLGYKEACEYLNKYCGFKIQIPEIREAVLCN